VQIFFGGIYFVQLFFWGKYPQKIFAQLETLDNT
jgi:hypothetical protein